MKCGNVVIPFDNTIEKETSITCIIPISVRKSHGRKEGIYLNIGV